jgi:hypothetical protein
MDKPSKLNERLTLVANLSVVVGIVFLAVELNQNTQAIQAQTRDSITEKQMEYLGWVATNRDLAEVLVEASSSGLAELDPVDRRMYEWNAMANLREFENSRYQYERGLFSSEEYEGRRESWRGMVGNPNNREVWSQYRERFAPSFRAEIDRIVAEGGN